MDNSPDKAQNVIAMTGYQPDTGYGAIAQIEAYWEAIRGTRLLPKRSDIDPRGIDQALANAFILERIAPGIARLRIAGSHLGDLMGMEVRGMPLTAFFTPAARPAVTELLEVVFQTPAISTLRLVSPGSGARPALNARMVLLPLKSDLGDVSRVLGGFVSKGDMGTAPRRFDVVSKEVTHLLAGHAAPLAPAPTFPHPAPTVPQTRKPIGVAEDQTPYIGKPGKKRPPYLRLVKSSENISDGS